MADYNMNDDQPTSQLDAIVSPLRARGIDPEAVRANPALLQQVLGRAGGPGPAAGLSQVAPQASAAPSTPVTAAPASVSPSGQPSTQDIGRTMLERSAKELQSVPSISDELAQEKALEERRQAAQGVLAQNLRDPQTGKLLPQYRPGIGQRIRAGLSSGKGIISSLVDPNPAPNLAGQQELRREQGNVAAADQSLNELARRFKESREAATGFASQGTALAREENVARDRETPKPYYNQKTDSIQMLTAAQVNAAEPGTLLPAEAGVKAQATDKTPTNYASAVIAAHSEKDPNGPLHQSVIEMEKHERSLQPPSAGHTMSKEELWHNAFVREFKREPSAAEVMSAGIAGAGLAGGAAAGKKNGPDRIKTVDAFNAYWKKDEFDPMEKKYDAQRKSAKADFDAKDLSQDQFDAKNAQIEAERASEKQQIQVRKDTEAERYNVYSQPQTPAGPAPGGKLQPPPAASKSLSRAEAAQLATSVRRNPNTGEHAYLVGGKWYKESELK